MQKVFTHENRLIVFHIKNILHDEGIECLIKNEFAGGGVGDLAPFETWPEIWVSDPDQDSALKLIKENLAKVPSGKEWICDHCGETNSFDFQVCWKCSTAET